MSLEGAFVIIRGGETYLINANIPPYQPKNIAGDYDPLRNRKLLLTKKEISELAGSEKNKSLTIVPISVYNKNRKIKVAIALVKGKKKFDKRETLKKRDTDNSRVKIDRFCLLQKKNRLRRGEIETKHSVLKLCFSAKNK